MSKAGKTTLDYLGEKARIYNQGIRGVHKMRNRFSPINMRGLQDTDEFDYGGEAQVKKKKGASKTKKKARRR